MHQYELDQLQNAKILMNNIQLSKLSGYNTSYLDISMYLFKTFNTFYVIFETNMLNTCLEQYVLKEA